MGPVPKVPTGGLPKPPVGRLRRPSRGGGRSLLYLKQQISYCPPNLLFGMSLNVFDSHHLANHQCGGPEGPCRHVIARAFFFICCIVSRGDRGRTKSTCGPSPMNDLWVHEENHAGMLLAMKYLASQQNSPCRHAISQFLQTSYWPWIAPLVHKRANVACRGA